MGAIHGLRWVDIIDSDADLVETISLEDGPVMETAEFKRLTMPDAERFDEPEE